MNPLTVKLANLLLASSAILLGFTGMTLGAARETRLVKETYDGTDVWIGFAIVACGVAVLVMNICESRP